VQPWPQEAHLEPQLARSVIPARVIPRIATVGGLESRSGSGFHAERHQHDGCDQERRGLAQTYFYIGHSPSVPVPVQFGHQP
jgi:hypothetical protein